MGISDTTRNNILKLIFNAVNWANVADNAAGTPATNFYLALHTADLGSAGLQNTSEAAYTGYARIASPRNSGEWTVTGNVVANTTEMSFPIASAGSETETFGSIGMLASGAGIVLISGAISPTIIVVAGVTPIFTLASTITIT